MQLGVMCSAVCRSRNCRHRDGLQLDGRWRRRAQQADGPPKNNEVVRTRPSAATSERQRSSADTWWRAGRHHRRLQQRLWSLESYGTKKSRFKVRLLAFHTYCSTTETQATGTGVAVASAEPHARQTDRPCQHFITLFLDTGCSLRHWSNSLEGSKHAKCNFLIQKPRMLYEKWWRILCTTVLHKHENWWL